MKNIVFIFLGIISGMNSAFANPLSLLDDGGRIVKGLTSSEKNNRVLEAISLSKVTQKSLNLSKIDNIQNLMSLAVNEKRVSFVDQFKYIQVYKDIKNGDKLLLQCLKKTSCNLQGYSDLMSKSPLHVEIATKYPHLNLPQINHRVGSINENIMNKYFQSSGWSKIEGEVGRNGIDGLFIKKNNGVIIDVLVVESKYNKSGLQHTKNGKQMSNQWVEEKIVSLQKSYPSNKDYDRIQTFIQSGNYRSMLWNLKTTNDDLLISLKKVHEKHGKVIISSIQGRDKMKINFNGNQEISIKNPKNNFQAQIVDWYQKAIRNLDK